MHAATPREDDEHEEPEADDTAVGEVLQRDAVRLDDVSRVLAEALPRDLERAGARALEARGGRTRRAPPPTSRGGGSGSNDPSRLGSLTTSAHSRPDVTASAAETDAAAPAPRTRARAPPRRARARGVGASCSASERPSADRDDERHDAGADEREHAEHGAVGDAVRARRDVLGQRRPRERPRSDERRRPGRRDEEEPARQTLPADEEPQREDDHADDDAGAREREQQRERRDVHEQRAENPHRTPMAALAPEPETEHDRDVGEERERVPVADRLAQPRDAVALGIERRDGLREQRPRERHAEHDREHPRGEPRPHLPPDGGEDDSDPEERAVRDRLVERVPAAIADDRPAHRDPDPEREPDQRADEHGARASDARHRQPAERDEHERDRECDDRRAADGEDPADVRPVAGEQSPREEARRRRPRRRRPRSRTPGRRAPTPTPWRATLAAASVCAAGGEGRRRGTSNGSFTLPTPQAHPVSGDSSGPGLPTAPHEISFVTLARSLRTFVVAVVLVLSAVAALSTAAPASAATRVREEGARGLVRQRPHRPPLSAQLLRGGDRRDPGRPARLRGRRGGHHARAPGRASRRPRAGRARSDAGRRRSDRPRRREATTRRRRRNRERRQPAGRAGRRHVGPVLDPDPAARARRECPSRCSPRAGSGTSRAVVPLRTATTRAARTTSRSRRSSASAFD